MNKYIMCWFSFSKDTNLTSNGILVTIHLLEENTIVLLEENTMTVIERFKSIKDFSTGDSVNLTFPRSPMVI